jgi:hypothetical protein
LDRPHPRLNQGLGLLFFRMRIVLPLSVIV